MALIDLLISINDNISEETGCIMDVLVGGIYPYNCIANGTDCRDCISDWLNEEVSGNAEG